MYRFIRAVSNGCMWAGVVLVVATSLDVFVNVIFRYLLAAPIMWSDELAVLIQVWFVFLPQVWLELQDDQLHLTILTSRIKSVRIHKILKTSQSILIPITYFFLAFYGYRFVLQNYRLGSTTFILEVPFWIVYAILPVSLCLAAFSRLGFLWSGKEESRVN